MALKATVYKASLQISDMNRGYYQNHLLTLARHPSETELRMMIRVLTFALNADGQLEFGKGLCMDEEPDLWHRSLDGEILLWIDLGQVDERRIAKACGRARQVIVYTYQPRQAEMWWQQNRDKLSRYDNLSVYELKQTAEEGDIEGVTRRNMQLQCTIQDELIWLSDENGTTLQFTLTSWKSS